jgi:hypothetical protein
VLSSPVALVLGAGSSRDFGANDASPFPLGDDLRLQIAQAINIHVDTSARSIKRGSEDILSAYRLVAQAANDDGMSVGHFVGAGQSIAQALPGCESIDDLLERHASNILYGTAGKLAIAHCISRAERNSPLRQNPAKIQIPEISNYSHHWLSRFLQGATKRCNTVPELSNVFSQLKVVNFNYDRCFEWFSFLWLRHVYSLNDQEAWAVMNCMDVIHPYGSLGPLPNGSNRAFAFGGDVDPYDLVAMHSNILTYSESVEEDRRADKVASLTRDCTRVIFLGFAFHEQNMKLLNFEGSPATREIYATTVAMPEPKWEAAQTRILNSLGQSRGTTVITRSSQSCCELIMDYGDRWIA